MNDRKRPVSIIFVGVLLASEVRAADLADVDVDPGAVLAVFKTKDKVFENAILRFTRWGEWRLGPFPFWKFPPRTPEEEQEARDNGPRLIKFRYHEEMVVRGRDTTITGELDPDLKQGPDSRGWTPGPYYKNSETAGVVRMISVSKSSAGQDRDLEIRNKGGPVGILGEKRMAIAFIHGFGFGERIKSIESIVRDGDRRIIRGTIQIGWDDVSTFRIELGDDLLVKKARIDCDVKGNLTRFDVTTEGAIERQGFLFARTGHYTRLAMGLKDDREAAREPSVIDEFSARFDDAKFHLTNDEYNTLTRMEMTPGTAVRDYVSNRRYRVEKDNTIKDEGVLIPKSP